MFQKRIKWVKLGQSKIEFIDRFPASNLKKITIQSKNICFVKLNEEVFALSDKCPHQGASLSKGSVSEDGFVVCPWHRYGFDCKNGRGPGYYVNSFQLKENPEGFFIGIEKGWFDF